MRIAIVGASGKTGIRLVQTALDRGYEVRAVCRDASAGKLSAFAADDRCTVITAPEVSDQAALTRALAGCDAVVAILITVRGLKATELVRALAAATAATGVTRLAFTAGEVTAVRAPGETYTLRQRFMLALIPPLTWFTPYSVTDMLRASELVAQQPGWAWTIVRAPALRDTPAAGYRLCGIAEITAADRLSRDDYAACLLDSLSRPERHRRTLAVTSAAEG